MTGRGEGLHPPPGTQDNSSSSTMVPTAGNSATSILSNNLPNDPPQDIALAEIGSVVHSRANLEKDFHNNPSETYAATQPKNKQPFKNKLKDWFAPEGNLRPFRLLKQDIKHIRVRYVSDWTTFNQLIFASAVYVFFTNILPGITFASDLYVLTGKTWGTIEVVFSTGLCGLIFSLWVSNFRQDGRSKLINIQILDTALDYPGSYWSILRLGREYL